MTFEIRPRMWKERRGKGGLFRLRRVELHCYFTFSLNCNCGRRAFKLELLLSLIMLPYSES